MPKSRHLLNNNSIVIRIPDDIRFLAEESAKMHGMTISDYVRSKVIESLEDEFDLKSYRESYEEYKKDPETYTLEEAMRILESGEEI